MKYKWLLRHCVATFCNDFGTVELSEIHPDVPQSYSRDQYYLNFLEIKKLGIIEMITRWNGGGQAATVIQIALALKKLKCLSAPNNLSLIHI